MRRSASRVLLITTGALIAASLSLRALFSRVGAGLFPAYRTCSKAWIGLLAQLWSPVPCAVWDLAAAVLVVCALVALVYRARTHRSVLPVLAAVACAVALSAFLFVAGWALNHYAPPLASDLGLEVRDSSEDELAEATEAYLLQAAERATLVPRSGDGALERQDFLELARIAGGSYEPLAEAYPVFEGSTTPVKALLLWGPPLLYSGHTGIFWAPTGESGVPLDCAVADMPYIMCHEAAHRLGIASEQEANFAAYLACEASDDARFSYAAAYQAFCYCFSALYRVDPDRAVEVVEQAAAGELGEGVALVWADRIATHEHYEAYDGPFERAGRAVNDSYLRGFGETEGVRSYGLVVDYLLAWRRAHPSPSQSPQQVP